MTKTLQANLMLMMSKSVLGITYLAGTMQNIRAASEGVKVNFKASRHLYTPTKDTSTPV